MQAKAGDHRLAHGSLKSIRLTPPLLTARITGYSDTSGLINRNGRSRLVSQRSPVMKFLDLCIQRQTAAVRLFLGFFRFGMLALEVGERYV